MRIRSNVTKKGNKIRVVNNVKEQRSPERKT